MTPARRQMLVAFVSGLLFAIGLGIAGMTNPHKVLAFLDVFGDWDPSLMFVMAGAILVYAPVYRLLRAREVPTFADRFHWPTRTDIDAKLVIGSAMFGIGWGLSGLCPGPALVAVATGATPFLVFGAAMLVGMLAHRSLTKKAPADA
jgi:uncharacterized membrane protein YedE/YeeE